MTIVPKPLGCFGRDVGHDPESQSAYRAELILLIGKLTADPTSVAGYLRSGSLVTAPMGYTFEVIDGRHMDLRERRHRGDRRKRVAATFGVAGGAAIVTDGTYYWRADTADYVEHYHVGLPEEFIEHMRRLDWQAPPLSEEIVREIDRALWPPSD